MWSKLKLNHSHQAQITQLSEEMHSCLSENRSHLHPPRWPNDNFGDEKQQVQSVIAQFYEPHLFARNILQYQNLYMTSYLSLNLDYDL